MQQATRYPESIKVEIFFCNCLLGLPKVSWNSDTSKNAPENFAPKLLDQYVCLLTYSKKWKLINLTYHNYSLTLYHSPNYPLLNWLYLEDQGLWIEGAVFPHFSLNPWQKSFCLFAVCDKRSIVFLRWIAEDSATN